MNVPSPPPKRTAISHSGAGCFPVVATIATLVSLFILLRDGDSNGKLLLIGIAVIITLCSLPAWQERRTFVRQSTVVQGQITRLWQTVVEDSEGGSTTHYYCAYTFPGGQETSQELNAQQCLFAKPGDPVTVRYLPNQSQVSQIDWQFTLTEKLQTLKTQ